MIAGRREDHVDTDPGPLPQEAEDLPTRCLLRPAILVLLQEQESHGYELMSRLAELGLDVRPTTGAVYRCLRTMAEEGLVSSCWTNPERGPARRVYTITDVGEQHLERYVPSLATLLRAVRDMLNRCRQGGTTVAPAAQVGNSSSMS